MQIVYLISDSGTPCPPSFLYLLWSVSPQTISTLATPTSHSTVPFSLTCLQLPCHPTCEHSAIILLHLKRDSCHKHSASSLFAVLLLPAFVILPELPWISPVPCFLVLLRFAFLDFSLFSMFLPLSYFKFCSFDAFWI